MFLVSAPPTLLVENGVLRKAAQLGNQTSILVGIFSQTTPTINISRLNDAHLRHEMMNYLSNITPARISLPVFDQIVETDGFQCLIRFTINTKEEFGEYQLSVTNSEGTTSRLLDILPEGKTFKDI